MLSASQGLAASAVLTWLMIMTTALLRSKMWTADGLKFAFGNRDGSLEVTDLAGRADRAAKNMLENMVMFTALFVAARMGNKSNQEEVALAANIFFFARLVYWIVYLIGVPYLRTAIWSVGVVAMGMLAMSALTA